MPEVTPQRPTYKTQTAKGTLYAYTRVNGRKVTLGRAGTPTALEQVPEQGTRCVRIRPPKQSLISERHSRFSKSLP